jgi:hypothetical protein
LSASRKQWVEKAGVRAAEVRPVALTFQTENSLTHLPAVAELATNQASGLGETTVWDERATYRNDAPAIAGLSPAAVATKIKAGQS